MSTYFTGKGYGVSSLLDTSGTPLLTWVNPSTGKPVTIFDRVAVTVDPTVKQVLAISQIYNARMDEATSQALKQAIGGTSKQELDHIIPLELGGANELANLGLDTNTPGTSNNPTDTFENQLSAAVQGGAMSLQDAWRAVAAAKGKVLTEDLKTITTKGWADTATSIFKVLGGVFSHSKLGTINQNLQAQIKQDLGTLAATPVDQATRIKVFTEQIDLTKEQLNLSAADSADYLKVYTSRYAQTKGVDPTELMGALTANEQKLIGISSTNPNLLGVNNVVWTQVAAALAVGQTVLLVVAALSLIIALFVGDVAAVLSLLATEGAAQFLSIFGLSTSITVATGAFFIAEILGGISTKIPMLTKQMYDNGSLLPTQLSSSLHQTIADIKALQKVTGSGTGSGTGTATVGGNTLTASPNKVFTGVVSSGVLGAGLVFTPRPSDIIENAQELQNAAQNNLASFVSALPSKLTYLIRIVSSVTNADGTTVKGTTTKVQTGVSKSGKATYKTVVNKFAVADVYVLDDKNVKHKIKTITLGPTNSLTLVLAGSDISSIQTAVQNNLTTSSISDVSTIISPTPVTTLIPNTPAADNVSAPLAPPPTPTSSIQKYIGTTSSGNQYEGTGSTPQTFISDKEASGQAVGSELTALQASRIPGFGASNMIISVVAKPVTTSQTSSLPAAALSAVTLSDFYSAQGKSLPSLTDRALLYQSLGLGSSSLYTGTAEQNTRLLAALKG